MSGAGARTASLRPEPHRDLADQSRGKGKDQEGATMQHQGMEAVIALARIRCDGNQEEMHCEYARWHPVRPPRRAPESGHGSRGEAPVCGSRALGVMARTAPQAFVLGSLDSFSPARRSIAGAEASRPRQPAAKGRHVLNPDKLDWPQLGLFGWPLAFRSLGLHRPRPVGHMADLSTTS